MEINVNVHVHVYVELLVIDYNILLFCLFIPKMKTSARSSDRATHSQKESFQRLRMKQPDSRNGRKGKGITKIRNWNIKTDNY